ncbi:conserved exported hypothetical protein [Candidatus Sulfopaludibacter sp. SbA6]|nr:conserved exported hypothetical protein [Candidatus Sulfopaludibacter sp. SbA6]
MKSLCVLCLTLGALPSFGETRQTPVAPIALYTQFQEEPPQAVAEALHDELESIMAPMGLRFEWHSLTGVRGNEVAVELAVLTFKGRCDVASLLPHNSTPGALGWTHVSDGIILPFSDVDCDRIRSFVQKELLAVHTDDRAAVFGRALGRVVAHELYHIFANTAKHGSCGVGKAAYTVQELLSEDFQFEARESEALRTSKAHAVLERATRAPTE